MFNVNGMSMGMGMGGGMGGMGMGGAKKPSGPPKTATIQATPAGRTSDTRRVVDSMAKLMNQRSFSPQEFAHAMDNQGGAFCIEFMEVIDAFLDSAVNRYDSDNFRSDEERDKVGVVANRVKDALNRYKYSY